MSKSKFTRSRIQEILMSGVGLDLRKARKLTEQIIGAVTAALAAGETVEMRGLGTFEPRERKPRKAHNPHTLEPVEVPARHVVFFRPCRALKAVIKEGDYPTKHE
jgi:nucleoid DNA-binding protein